MKTTWPSVLHTISRSLHTLCYGWARSTIQSMRSLDLCTPTFQTVASTLLQDS